MVTIGFGQFAIRSTAFRIGSVEDVDRLSLQVFVGIQQTCDLGSGLIKLPFQLQVIAALEQLLARTLGDREGHAAISKASPRSICVGSDWPRSAKLSASAPESAPLLQ
jgi:hypothetical protein